MTHDTTQHFLDTIKADRDREIAQIRADTDVAVQRIRSEAHAQAQHLQRDTNQRLRQELSVRKHREESRVQARIRRKRWQGLEQLHRGINEQVLDRMNLAWSDAEWQWCWCHFWLQAAAARNDGAPLRLAIAETVLPETLERIKQWAGKIKLSISFDSPVGEPGLIINWADFELDGSIYEQSRSIEAAVLAGLTPLLPRLNQINRP